MSEQIQNWNWPSDILVCIIQNAAEAERSVGKHRVCGALKYLNTHCWVADAIAAIAADAALASPAGVAAELADRG